MNKFLRALVLFFLVMNVSTMPMGYVKSLYQTLAKPVIAVGKQMNSLTRSSISVIKQHKKKLACIAAIGIAAYVVKHKKTLMNKVVAGANTMRHIFNRLPVGTPRAPQDAVAPAIPQAHAKEPVFEEDCPICATPLKDLGEDKIRFTHCCSRLLCLDDYDRMEGEAQILCANMQDPDWRREYGASEEFTGWAYKPEDALNHQHATCPYCRNYPLAVFAKK